MSAITVTRDYLARIEDPVGAFQQGLDNDWADGGLVSFAEGEVEVWRAFAAEEGLTDKESEDGAVRVARLVAAMWADKQPGGTFATRTEAIEALVVGPIQASGEVADARAEFDIAAIADAAIFCSGGRYFVGISADSFWSIVSDHDIAGVAERFWLDDDPEFSELVNAVLAKRYPRVTWVDDQEEFNLLVRGNGQIPAPDGVIDYESVWASEPQDLRAELEQS